MNEWNAETMEAVAERQLNPQTQRQQSGLTVQRESVNPRLIYDVGAHIGEDTEFYLKKGFRVIAIEANPILVEKLKAKFRPNIADGSLILIDCAIAKTAGEVAFYVNPRTEWSTSQPAFAERNAHMGSPSEQISVNALRFQDVLAEHGIPYYLKIDVEGADVLCLEGLLKFSDRPRYVSMESDKRSWRALVQEFELFERLGYTKFKIVDQEQVYRVKVPRPAKEGRYIEHRFEPGSSGLFGRELPGKWLTMRQALRRYRLIYLRYLLFGDYGVLRWAILQLPGFHKAATAERSAKEPSALRKALGAILKFPLFEFIFKSHWYDTHATV
jgi:FkbM family methyltransferase